MRFTLSTILLLLLPCSVFLAGVANGPNLTQHERVLLEVLHDMIYTSGDYRPLSVGPDIPATLFILRDIPSFPPCTEETLDEFLGMPIGKDDALAQAIEDLHANHESGTPFNISRLSTNRIQVVEKPNMDVNNQAYMAIYPAQVFLPGFSDDGSVAVVNMWFSELYHPSVMTYILIKRNGRWTIHFRGIATYA